jgi:hypothetical protein
VGEREDQEPVGARRDAVPVVGDGIVARADRVHGDDAGAAGLELADPDLDRIRIVVLGHAEEEEELRPLPVGLAEFPEGAADRVDARGRHVDGTEAAMRGVVGRAEGLRPPAGEGLRLVAAGEEGEAFGGGLAERLQPGDGGLKRLLPGDLLEAAFAARPHAAEGGLQAGGRGDLLDPRRALGAEDAPVHRVVAVALDIGDAPVLDMHVDPAAAGAHVAGGLAHLRGARRLWLGAGHAASVLPVGRRLDGRGAGFQRFFRSGWRGALW